MKKIRIYVEGGGGYGFTLRKCSSGFRKFFEKIMPGGKRPKVIACGGRNHAFRKFTQAYKEYDDENVILLVDSEGPVIESVWDHLEDRDGWSSDGFSDESAQLMVQTMESWFLADKETLENFYGQNFSLSSLPANNNIEEIDKNDVAKGLDNATRNTSKGLCHKTRHAFEILALIDPNKLDDKNISKHTHRLLSHLKQLTADS